MKLVLGDKLILPFGGWGRWLTVDEDRYWVGVEKGKRVRIPYVSKKAARLGAPRFGFQWWGYVRDSRGREIYRTRVDKNVSAKTIVDAWLQPEY